MEKKLRTCLRTSPETFLETAKTSLSWQSKSTKPTLKSIIHTIPPSSPLSTSLPPSLHTSITSSILALRALLDAPPPLSPPSKRPRRSEKDTTIADDRNADKAKVINELHILTLVCSLSLTHPKNALSPSDLLPAARELHDNLIVFEAESGSLCSEVFSLCELCWKEGFDGREDLISLSLPFLLSRSLTLKKKVDVHRAYALREAFVLFDFEDESIEDLKMLLIRCVIAPLYLKTEDGRKFLAAIFGLSLQLAKEALAVVKSQIPFGRKSVLEAYGVVLFLAWKGTEGEVKVEIEDGFLQGLRV